MLAISDREQELLSELRQDVSDILEGQDEYHQTDSYLTTWLRFKEHNVPKAAAAFRKAAKWKEEQKIEGIQNETIFPPEMLPYEHYGHDKAGRPVIWVPFGRFWDLATIAQKDMHEEFFRFSYQFIEIIEKRIRNDYYKRLEEDGQIVWQFTIVIDGGGFSYRQLFNPKALKMIRNLVMAAENNWPMRCGGVIIVNAPGLVKTLFNILKPLMSEMTRSVFQIYNHNREEWERVLKDHIPIEDIPTCYGGTRKSEIDIYYLNN